MRTLRCLLAIGLVCGLSGVAKADDFQMVVVDPIPSSLVIPILHDDFTASLSPCDPSQLPPSLVGTYLGCFTGQNDTGKPITSLEILIPVFDYPASFPQSAGCVASGSGQDIFSSVTCGTTPDGKDFFLDFTGGSIPIKGADCDHDGDSGGGGNGDDQACSIFTIAEAGVTITPDFNPFSDMKVIANAPEPKSFWLMTTGVLSIGMFGAYRRRHTLRPTR